MSLFDSASLVVTPNGYKEDKLYAIKPSDGSGDLVVTRATTATRVNSDGLIEVTPYNLLQRSEEFNNAIWTKLNSTITANSVIAPNGNLTADTFTTSNVNATIDQNVTFQNPCTFSIYVKYIDSQFIQLYAGVSSQTRANFDILNGVLGNRGTDTSNSTIESVGNGWYKLTATFINNSGASNIRIKFVASLTSGWGVASTNAINSAYFWGAQLVTGTSAKEYFPTTDRLDVPRLDYTNSTCPSILVEPQRTNLLQRSEEFENAYWVKDVDVTVNSNFSISPSGDLNADRVNFASNNKAIYRAITSSGAHTFSIYLKGEGANIGKQIQLIIGNVGGSVNVTLTDQWQRFTANATTSTYVGISRVLIGQADSVLVWGAQLEAGANATSYIPTIASSVTRNADVISKTGISSLIGQTEGTLYVEISASQLGSGFARFNISDGTANNWVFLGKNLNKLRGFVRSNNVTIFDNESTILSDGFIKCAIAYKSTECALFINGLLISSNTTAFSFTSALNSLHTGNQSVNPNTESALFKSVILFKERLSNETLAQLTTI